ncbi:rhodanese-like domain-containing protein [Solimicrobium silvestre]|uniref:Rhodanese-like domain n=1 Tax=Solimicrobium silvestre TaxID=2099400 RepID=A0A2S9H499_9BURK|nr:rhodanese-like domain-containing protein [Solimicrobium silvestre]PRC94814.1 Rhodanese-like domain [Solimicrobium silvestre]
MKIARNIKLCCALLLLLPLLAQAELKILIGVDPADEVGKNNVDRVISSIPELNSALGSKVFSNQSSNLTDVLRSTRTQENDIIIGPPHIIASAISHHYQVLARNEADADFVLIARPDIKKLDDIAGKRLYLTQQDSTRTYVAKGMLIENNIDIKSIKQVTYGKTSGAGLFALAANLTDMTIASREEAQSWILANPGQGVIIKTSRRIPAGMALVVKSDTSEAVRKIILKWASSSTNGVGKFRATTNEDVTQYRYIASLGILTPASLSGVQTVTADEVSKLVAKGVTVVDTRSAKEYQLAHIAGAINAAYVEHSLKERDFDPKLDDYSAIAALPKEKAVIFLCNGTECWKSYKASKIALQLGFTQIYWFRGGMPEWQEKSLPTKTGS